MPKNRIAPATLAAGLALAFAPAAHSQGFVPEFQEGINFIGLAVGAAPDYSGSDDYMGGIAPYGRYLYSGERYVQLLGPELTVNLVNDKNWRLGPVVRYRFGRDDDVDDKVVRRMREIDDTTEAGVFVGYRVQLSANRLHQLSFAADVLTDTGNEHEGVTASARLVCPWAALKSAISRRRRSTSPVVSTCSHAAATRSGWRTTWPYGVAWPST